MKNRLGARLHRIDRPLGPGRGRRRSRTGSASWRSRPGARSRRSRSRSSGIGRSWSPSRREEDAASSGRCCRRASRPVSSRAPRGWRKWPRTTKTEIVVGGLVGALGLRSAYAAARAGKRLALANKETLVVGGRADDRRAAKRAARRSCRSTPSTARSTRRCAAAAHERGRAARAHRVRRPVPRAGRSRPSTRSPSRTRSRIRPGRWGRRSRSIRPR